MKIATNPGSNLSRAIVSHYGISLSPQRIHVDGENHDTRDEISLDQIDTWTRTAKKWPEVIGSTSAELVHQFKTLIEQGPDREVLSIQTSRKIIQSHRAAMSAKKTYFSFGAPEGARIEVHDTTVTDAGAGLSTILAAEADGAGLSMDDTLATLDAFAAGQLVLGVPQTLKNFVKGGRATFLRAWVADMLKLRPMLSMEDGELKVARKVSLNADLAETLIEQAAQKIEPGRRVWAAVTHGNDPERAAPVAQAICKTWDVAFLYEVPLSASIYLHGGPGAVFIFMAPIDALPWTPPVPSVHRVIGAAQASSA